MKNILVAMILLASPHLYSQDTLSVQPPQYIEPEIINPFSQKGTEQVNTEDSPEDAAEIIDYTIPKDVIVKDLIEKKTDGTYYYKFEKKSDDRTSGNFRFGIMSPPAISTLISSDLGSYELTYKDMYTNNPVPILIYDYEWAPFSSWRNLRFQGGVGGFFTTAQGRFATPVIDSDGQETYLAREKYNFIGIPVSLGLVLRFRIANSWFVPFVNGGGIYTALIETRDDGQKTNMLGTPSVYGGGGLMINLTQLDRDTSFVFDRDYGVSNLWLNFEGRVVKGFSKELDLSSTIALFGIVADY